MRDATLVGEGNEAFLIRVWKPLPSRRILNCEADGDTQWAKADNIY